MEFFLYLSQWNAINDFPWDFWFAYVKAIELRIPVTLKIDNVFGY